MKGAIPKNTLPNATRIGPSLFPTLPSSLCRKLARYEEPTNWLVIGRVFIVNAPFQALLRANELELFFLHGRFF